MAAVGADGSGGVRVVGGRRGEPAAARPASVGVAGRRGVRRAAPGGRPRRGALRRGAGRRRGRVGGRHRASVRVAGGPRGGGDRGGLSAVAAHVRHPGAGVGRPDGAVAADAGCPAGRGDQPGPCAGDRAGAAPCPRVRRRVPGRGVRDGVREGVGRRGAVRHDPQSGAVGAEDGAAGHRLGPEGGPGAAPRGRRVRAHRVPDADRRLGHVPADRDHADRARPRGHGRRQRPRREPAVRGQRRLRHEGPAPRRRVRDAGPGRPRAASGRSPARSPRPRLVRT